jgi:hypothetical protein
MRLPPIVSSCLFAVAIDCCSNIIAQRFKAYSNHGPFVFDHTLFVQFMIMGAIGAPINFHWQCWLERAFPGWKVVKQTHDTMSLDTEEKQSYLKDEDGAGLIQEEEVRVRDWYNIFRKWFTDCITMGALLNTTLFLVVMGILKGKTWSQVGTDLRTVRLSLLYVYCESLC